MSSDRKFNEMKSDTSSFSFGATATKAKDSLEALILKTEKKKEREIEKLQEQKLDQKSKRV